MRGLVSLVGVGPGDPGLLTLRGARVIERADTVLYDALVHPLILRHARPEAEVLFVGKRKGVDSATQDEINHMLLYRARQGRRVARLKGGDPLLFGRGAEEAEFLAREGVAFELIPGVTAALGAAAYAGIPLSHRDLSSSIALVAASERPGKLHSAHDWSRLATATQTVVFYMAMHRLAEDLAGLVTHGRDPATPAAAIQWGTWPEQRVVTGTVADLAERCLQAELGAPALVIVGEVVRLRETLRWWDIAPLFGRRVLVTRAREQAGKLVVALVDRGAAPVEFPAIRFEDVADPAPLARAVAALVDGAYRAVAFTSQNGVERFFRALEARGLDARAVGRAQVVAVGPATAEALRGWGIRADATAREFIGEGVATALGELIGADLPGARVLIPCAEAARDTLPEALRAAGALPDVLAVYRTLPATTGEVSALRSALEAGQVDIATFMSGSAVTSLCAALGPDAPALLARTLVASIGPVTSQTARAQGLAVGVEAREHTSDGLLDALDAHLRSAPGSP